MERDALVQQIIEYAKKAFQYEGDDLSESTNIKETFGTNSMKRISLCALIENELDVVIPVVQLGKYETLGDLVDQVQKEL